LKEFQHNTSGSVDSSVVVETESGWK